jgi:hypothetical protein
MARRWAGVRCSGYDDFHADSVSESRQLALVPKQRFGLRRGREQA